MRNYKKKTDRGEVPYNIWLQAVRAVKKENYKISVAARRFGVNSNTLRRYVKKFSPEEIEGNSAKKLNSHTGYSSVNQVKKN